MEEVPKISPAHDSWIAVFVTGILLVFLGSYQFARRGFLWEAPVSAGPLYVPNEVIAGSAVMLLAFVFLIGPLVRYFDTFDRWLNYRKEIGIAAGILAIMHGILSAWFVPQKFSLEWLFSGEAASSSWTGLLGALLFAVLIVFSLKFMIETIGGGKWWFFQRWGVRLLVILTLLHVIPMKWSGWMAWFQHPGLASAELWNPALPPGSLLVAGFIVWVALVRLYETIFVFQDVGVQTKEISMDAVLKTRGRRFVIVTFFLWLLGMLLLFVRGFVA